MKNPLWQWSATDLAKNIREKKVSCEEVIQAHLDRIEAINQKVNAVTVVLHDEALLAAREADKKVESGEETGPLHGVPITIKENIDLVGSATTQGVVVLKDAMPQTDAPVVSLLKQAGAIPIGRTNLSDLALRWHTCNDLRGATLNPWDPSVTPGGSSGGDAAAIATGMTPIGIGNDISGSLRYPSQCCGITAIRPSFGRVSQVMSKMIPNDPLFYAQIGGVNGPMARHVQDLRLALEVMSGMDSTDPWWAPALQLGSDMPEPVRIAVTTDPLGEPGSAVVAAAVRKAADIFSDSGYLVEEVDLPSVNEAIEVMHQIFDIDYKSLMPLMLPISSGEIKTFFNDNIVGNTSPDLSIYMTAIARRYRIAREWNLFMEKYPLILGPVSTLLPFKVGYDIAGPEEKSNVVQSMGLTGICNLLGLPSVATPVQVVDSLPQGIQLIGRRYYEDLCFDAAEIIEKNVGVFTPIDPRSIPC